MNIHTVLVIPFIIIFIIGLLSYIQYLKKNDILSRHHLEVGANIKAFGIVATVILYVTYKLIVWFFNI